jgi:hypothetical protein
VNAAGLAAKIASAASKIVAGLPAILAAMPDNVSPRTTRYVCPCGRLPPASPRARADAFARTVLTTAALTVASGVAAPVRAAATSGRLESIAGI